MADTKDNKKNTAIGCFAVIGLVLMLGMCFGGGEQEAPKQIPESQAIPVSATELFEAYQENEARAQSRYGDKLLRVTGKVASIDLGITDEPTISLETPNQFMPATIASNDSVKDVAARLNKGDEITAICGKVREFAGRPFLDDCVIK